MEAQRIRIKFYKNKLTCCNHKDCNWLNSRNFRIRTVEEYAKEKLISPRLEECLRRRSLVIPQGPSEIMDVFSTMCNIRCRFCCLSDQPRKHNPQLEKCMREYATGNAANVRKVSFCGGEPLVQRYVIEMIKTVSKTNPDVDFYITTNLTHLTPEVRALFETINLNPIHISLNAASPEGYEAVVSGAKWETVFDNFLFIADLHRRRPEHCVIDASMVVTNRNYRDIVPYAKIGVENNVRRIEYYPMIETGWNRDIQLNSEEKAAVREILKDPIFEEYKDRIEIGPLKSSVKSASN